MIQLNRKMIFVKVNGLEDTLNSKKFGISGYPTIVLLDRKGQEIDRIVGYEPPAEFLNSVQMYLEGKETLADYLQRAEQSPDSVGLQFALAEKCDGRSNPAEAKKYYMAVIERDPQNESGFTDKALHSYAWLLFRDKDVQGAIDCEQKIIDQFPNSDLFAEAHQYVPYYYSRWSGQLLESGDKELAATYREKSIELFEAFIEKFPDSEDVEWAKKEIAKLKEIT